MTGLNRVKAFFFDWSGTLSNDLSPVIDAVNLVLLSYGCKKVSMEEFKEEFKLPAIEFYKKKGVNDSWENIYFKFKEYFAALNTIPKCFPFANNTLQKIRNKNYKIFVFSAHPQEFVEKEARNNSLLNLIDKIFGNIEDKKKELIQVIREENINAAESFFVGDMQHDILAGKHAGMKTIAVLTGYHSKEKLEKVKPDFIVKNAEKITSLI